MFGTYILVVILVSWQGVSVTMQSIPPSPQSSTACEAMAKAIEAHPIRTREYRGETVTAYCVKG